MHAEGLQEALDRIATRRGDEVFKSPTVTSMLDIKRLLSELDPSRAREQGEVVVQASATGVVDRQMRPVALQTTTKSMSKRETLLAGFMAIKRNQVFEGAERKPMIINGREMFQPTPSNLDAFAWVDPMLKRWLAAERRGLLICWDLNDGYTYMYDIFEHRLTRKQREDKPAESTE